MSRMEITALLKVAESAEAGRYTLPAELTNAIATYDRARSVTAPEQVTFNVDQVAGSIVATLAAGDTLDVAQLVTNAATVQRDTEAVGQIRVAISTAIELAASSATLLADDLTEKVITDHLAPAYQQLLEEVREVAASLDGYGLDAHALLTAPTKIRNAYLKLPELAVRNKTLREARRLVNTIGHRKPKHDAQDLFSLFSQPMALRPDWKAPARVPHIDMPTDPIEFLVWLVSDKAAPGKPWLPTVAEQDAAWWKQFGEAQEMRNQAHRNGLAVGARIG